MAADTLPDLAYVLDREGQLLYWNRAIVENTGYSDEEIRSMLLADFFPAEEYQRVRAAIEKAWTVGTSAIETEIVTKSGVRTACEFSSSLYRDQRGTPLALCGSARDLTERKAFETALRESELRYRALFEASRDALMVLGENGPLFSAGNSAALEMFGCEDLGEFLRHGPVSLSPPFQPDGRPSELAAREAMERTLRLGSNSFDWVHCRVDGTEFETSVLLTRIEIGGRQLVQATVRDISVGKAIERALRANEQKLRMIAGAAVDAIVMIDPAGLIVHWNPAAAAMFGHSVDEAIGTRFHELLGPPEAGAPGDVDMVEFLSSGTGPATGRVFEFSALCKDGKQFPVEASVSRTRSEEGWATVVIIRDVSDRKRLEEVLRKRTTELTAKVRELSCLERASGVFERSDLNPIEMIERVVALLPEAVQDRPHACARITYHAQEFHTADFAEEPISLQVPLIVAQEPVGSIEIRCAPSQSTPQGTAFSDEERMLLEQLAVRLGRAVERYLSNEEIKALNQKLELILAATRTRFLLTDEDCVVRYADPETQRQYGTLANQKCSRYLFLSSECCSACPKTIPEARDRTVIAHFTLPLEKDRIFQRTSVPIRSHAGEQMYAAVLVDVTEQKALEVKLNQASKLEAVGQLAAGIAHEINTPTQFVGDNTRFLGEGFHDLERVLVQVDRLLEKSQGGTVDAEQLDGIRRTIEEVDAGFLRNEIPESIQQTLQGVSQIASIVRAMKEFSHPGSREKQAIDINRAVENTLTVSRGEWKHLADLVLDLQPNLPPVPCYPADLNQVVLNIVVNAAHAIAETPSGHGTITVSTRRCDDWIVIEIGDTGPGIPEDIRPRVFDHFFTTKQVGKGTGQGLTIAYAMVVEKHGGTLDFRTELGKGTTFVIRLPLRDQPAEQKALFHSIGSVTHEGVRK